MDSTSVTTRRGPGSKGGLRACPGHTPFSNSRGVFHFLYIYLFGGTKKKKKDFKGIWMRKGQQELRLFGERAKGQAPASRSSVTLGSGGGNAMAWVTCLGHFYVDRSVASKHLECCVAGVTTPNSGILRLTRRTLHPLNANSPSPLVP